MDTPTPKLSSEVSFRRRFTPWHSVAFGAVALVGLSWHYLGVLAGWSGADALMHQVGWFVFPLSFVTGLGVVACSLVLCFRRRDWRLVIGLVLAAVGITISVVDFFWGVARVSL